MRGKKKAKICFQCQKEIDEPYHKFGYSQRLVCSIECFKDYYNNIDISNLKTQRL